MKRGTEWKRKRAQKETFKFMMELKVACDIAEVWQRDVGSISIY